MFCSRVWLHRLRLHSSLFPQTSASPLWQTCAAQQYTRELLQMESMHLSLHVLKVIHKGLCLFFFTTIAINTDAFEQQSSFHSTSIPSFQLTRLWSMHVSPASLWVYISCSCFTQFQRDGHFELSSISNDTQHQASTRLCSQNWVCWVQFGTLV